MFYWDVAYSKLLLSQLMSSYCHKGQTTCKLYLKPVYTGQPFKTPVSLEAWISYGKLSGG